MSRPFASSGVAGQTILSLGICANELSGFCEWNGPPEKPPPDGSRTTIGTGVPGPWTLRARGAREAFIRGEPAGPG